MTTHDCGNQPESPLDASLASLGVFIWIAPLFFAAAALSASIIYTYWKRSSSTITAMALVAVHVLATAVVGVISTARANPP